MTDELRDLRPPPPSARALETARAALLAETKVPRLPWRRQAGLLIAASLGFAALVAVVALGSGAAAPATLAARWVTLLLLSVTGPLLAWSAVMPGGTWLRRGAAALAGLSALALVLTRPATVPLSESSPEWWCTASHLAVAVPAAVVALRTMLRNMAFDASRSVLAGLAVGTTGALLGELLCGRDATHLALFHLSSWTLASLAVLAVSARVRRRSFAP